MTTNYRRFPNYTSKLSDFRWKMPNTLPYGGEYQTLADRRNYYEKRGAQGILEYYPTTGDFYRETRHYHTDFSLDKYNRGGTRVDYYATTGSFYRRDYFRKYGNTSSYSRSVSKSTYFRRGITSSEDHNPKVHAATKTYSYDRIAPEAPRKL